MLNFEMWDGAEWAVYSSSLLTVSWQGCCPNLRFVSQQLWQHPWINHLVDIYSNVLAALQGVLKRIQCSHCGQQPEQNACNVNVVLVCEGGGEQGWRQSTLALNQDENHSSSVFFNQQIVIQVFFMLCNWQLWHCILRSINISWPLRGSQTIKNVW